MAMSNDEYMCLFNWTDCDYLLGLYNIIFMNSVLRMFVHVVVRFPFIK